jgi:hypothetical protein
MPSSKKKKHQKKRSHSRSSSKSSKVVRKSYSSKSFPEELSRCWSDLSKGKCPSKKRVIQCYCKGRPYKDDKRQYKVETKAMAVKRWAQESKKSSSSRKKKTAKSGFDGDTRMKIYRANKEIINTSTGHWATNLKNFLKNRKPEDFDERGKLKRAKGSSPKPHSPPRSPKSPKKGRKKSPRPYSPPRSSKAPKKVHKIDEIGDESDISSIFGGETEQPELPPPIPPKPSSLPRPRSIPRPSVPKEEDSDSDSDSDLITIPKKYIFD